MSPVHPHVDSPFPDDWKEEINESLYEDRTEDRTSLIHAIGMGIQHSYSYDGPLLTGTEDPVLPISLMASSDFRAPEDDDCSSQDNSWLVKEVQNWGPADVIHWINHEADTLGIYCTEIQGEKFAKLTGNDLLKYDESDFQILDAKYGQRLYKSLQRTIAGESFSGIQSLGYVPSNNGLISDNSVIVTHDLDSKYEISEMNIKYEALPSSASDNISNSDPEQEFHKSNEQVPEKKKPGRPRGSRRKKTPGKEKLGRLWEFIRDLLKNKEYCPSLIVWDNYEEGMFRFVRSDQVAKLWGSKKDNPGMTYEKLSRAMRYYYKSKVLQPVLGRRLVYKFGPSATDWRVDNPNFKH